MNWLAKLICFFRGHDWTTIWWPHGSETWCRRCGKILNG